MAAFADDAPAALRGVLRPVVERDVAGIDAVVGMPAAPARPSQEALPVAAPAGQSGG